MRENAKYLDRTRDLITPREARLAKIWLRDAGIFCLYVGNSGKRHDPNKRSSGESERYKYHGDPQRKIYIPLSEEHRELHRLENHLKTFTDLENIARSKGLGENPDVAIAGVQKEGTGLP